MELVDRYLQVVKFWLPGNQKDDIIAELSEDLRSQIEEKESEIGRKLSDAEVEPILKQCGAPMAVAGRYLPQRSLIGPALFPIYSKVIRWLFLYFLLPWFVLWLGIAIFSPDFQGDHPGIGILGSLEPWWLACTHALFFNTLAFALLDRSQVRSQLVNTWTPRSLPAVRDCNRIPRSGTLFEITFSVATLALWLQLGAFHRTFHSLGVTLTLSPLWPYFFWGLTVLSVASVGLACLNLSHPRWTPLSACLRLGIDVYCWGLIYWVCRAALLESLVADGLSSDKAAALVHGINSWMANSAIWVVAIGLLVMFFDVKRILRLKTIA
jgi:hypothetical protein